MKEMKMWLESDGDIFRGRNIIEIKWYVVYTWSCALQWIRGVSKHYDKTFCWCKRSLKVIADKSKAMVLGEEEKSV